MRPLSFLAAGAAALALLAGAGAAMTQEPSAMQALVQARALSMKVRQGQYDLAPQSVALLEAATQRSPDDVRLWNALGVAYFEQITAKLRAKAFGDLPALFAKARDAHGKALQLDPNNAQALSGHGTALAIVSGFAKRPEMGRQGIAELNRAAELGPTETVVRLQRGFTNLGVGAEIRDTKAAEADLAWLIAIAQGSRSGDMLHVLLGDLYAETGRPELARAQYAAAGRPKSAIPDLATTRLASLAQGGPSAADMNKLRNGLGGDCAMCHAP